MRRFVNKIVSICAVLCMLVYTPAYAAPQLTVIDEHKGLERNPKADKIQDGAHDVFTNVFINDGNISVVKGRDRLNNTANADTVVNMFCYYENAAATTKKLIVKETDEVVTYDVDGTNRTQIAASLTNEKADCTQIGDTLYFTSSTDGIYKWTGSGSASALGSVSAPSSVNFSAQTADKVGGLTPGTEATATCFTGAVLGSAFELYSVYDDFVCGGGGTWKISCPGATEGVTLINPGTTSYKYKIVKHSSTLGITSEPSSSDEALLSGEEQLAIYCSTSIADQFIAKSAQTSTLGTLAAAPSSPFNEYCVYRTVASGSEFFLVGCQDTGAFTDGKPDVSLGEPLDTTVDTISPPSFRYINTYKGIIFVAEGNEVRFSRLLIEAGTDADTYWLETDQLSITNLTSNITGAHTTSDSLLIFSNKNITEISGFSADTMRVRTLVNGFGAVSDETIETDGQGDIIFFAGAQGVFKLRTFQQPQDQLTGSGIDAPRVGIQKLSSPVLDDVFLGEDASIVLNTSDYPSSHAYYDSSQDLYFLYIGDDCLVFDNANSSWSYIPASDVDASVYRRSINESGKGVLIDNSGFFYNNWTGYANGVESGTVTGKPTSSTASTLVDSGASFDTTDDGLKGAWVFVDNENGEYRQILSNTATEITTVTNWTNNPTTADDYYIGYIIPEWRTKQYQFDKAPRESNVNSFWIINNKSDSSQDLEFYTYENKSSTPSRQLSGVVDLSSKFINKIGSKLRSSWVQWSFRSFVYNTSDTISTPVDVTSYAVEVDIMEER